MKNGCIGKNNQTTKTLNPKNPTQLDIVFVDLTLDSSDAAEAENESESEASDLVFIKEEISEDSNDSFTGV
jgi:hypothetical protein